MRRQTPPTPGLTRRPAFFQRVGAGHRFASAEFSSFGKLCLPFVHALPRPLRFSSSTDRASGNVLTVSADDKIRLSKKIQRTRPSRVYITIALCALLSLTVCANRVPIFAQCDVATAAIQGRVTDQAEAVVRGATVTVISAVRGFVRNVKTDNEGLYHLPLLQPGRYELRIEDIGFQSQTLQSVLLTVGQVMICDFKLQVGRLEAASSTNAPPNLIETTRTHQSDTIERGQIATLPNLSRNFTAAVFTLSAVADTEAARVQQTRVVALRTSGFSVGGSNGRSNYISIDGGENDSGTGSLRIRNLSVETVQEFQVNLNAFSAEYGFTSGTAVNVVTRSGTNKFHGSGYGFYRSEKTAARDPLNQSGKKALERRLVPGFTLGGPLVTNTAFFFTSFESGRYEVARTRDYTNTSSSLQPTEAQTAYLQILETGPDATGTTRNIAAQLRTTLSTLNYPTTMKILRDSEGQFIAPSRSYNWTTRLDYNRNERDFFNGRFTLAKENNNLQSADNLEAPSSGIQETLDDDTVVGTWGHILSNRLVNQLRVQFVADDYRQLTPAPESATLLIAGLINYGRLRTVPQALSSLPPHTVVFFVTATRDSASNNYHNPDVLRQISAASSAPIYGTTVAQLGSGIVGGSIVSFEAFGVQTAELGLRVLAGEKPQTIAPHGVPNLNMFDWRELHRWGIDESKLPVGSIVINREFSAWELYKWRIIGAIALIILQALLIIGLLLNLTKRRKAEGASKLNETRYRNVVETQTELICRYHPDTTLTFVNDAYCRYYGKSSEQLIGTKFCEFLPEHARAALLTHISSLIDDPRNETYEHEVLLSNGEAGWQEWVNHVTQSTTGDAIELQGIGRDITEKRQAEEELRRSEMRFRHMADTSEIFIWIADPNMFCTYFNRRVLDFTGRTMDQLLGEGWLGIIHQDDVQRCVAVYTAGYEKREPFVLEFRIRRADGVFRWIYDTGAPRFGSNGELLGYIGSAVDITDRRTAEEALQIAHEEVSKLKNQLEAENVYLQEEIKLAHNVDEIIGESQAIKYVLFKIEQVSQTDTTTLILGETGTGKELVARAIHNQSGRKDRPLVKVNCAALSASLIESELFGHEKGAFTGATARKVGRFELADGATIFLDEVGELPLELQAKLLRVLQEGEFERLGGTKTLKVDVRILAATNRNLKDEVAKGTFREDLWYRLNVFPLTVPPLRQRKEDVPLMVEHFVRGYSRKVGKTINSISAANLKKLKDYSWPGNVRELANVIERAVVNAQGPILQIADQFEQPRPEKDTDLARTLEEVEKEYILRVLDSTGWKIRGANGAAEVLGLNSSTLRTRMLKLGIQKSAITANVSGAGSRR